MVVHVGINFVAGEGLAYDTTQNNKEPFEINFDKKMLACLMDTENLNLNEIQSMFDIAKSQINSQLGCLCICLAQNFNNFLSIFIKEIGFKNGWEKVQVINVNTAKYYMAISQSDIIPKNNDIIWILDGSWCLVWHIVDGNIRLVNDFKGNLSSTEEVRKTIKRSKVKKIPDFVFYEKSKTQDFPKYLTLYSKMVPFENLSLTKGTLFKAQKMARNPQLQQLAVIENFFFKINDEKFGFDEQINPPCKKIKTKPLRYRIPKQILIFDDQIKAVGIDLGTTRCCEAVNRTNKIEIVAIENTGDRLMPSYVAYDEENVKCGQVVVNRLRNYSNSTIFDSKRIIGKTFDEIEID
uniref:Uncharacterized protein n=1 Tax=Panagrolaimus sp. ES5 TaxID=591445 RepID=A0AC34FJ54_9BILA